MGIFWGSSSNNSVDKSGNNNFTNESNKEDVDNIPDDLKDFLNKKESQLSNREFKVLLQRQSANAEASKLAEKENNNEQGADFLTMLQAKNPQDKEITNKEDNNVNVISDKDGNKIEIPKLPTSVSMANSMKKPKDYQNFELEKYRRENDEKEVVLTNCSEIQYAFYECLGRQSIWDRVSAISKLDSDECTKLADFFMACTEIQKKAFLMFDYSTLETIDEMKTASNKIDKVFNKSFKNIDDIREKEKFLGYTKELRKERENFFNTFNK